MRRAQPHRHLSSRGRGVPPPQSCMRRSATDMRRAYVAAAAGVLLAGCKVGPDYHRPAVDAPKAFLYEPAEAATAASLDWWTQFNDPVLNQLIADGLANN